MTDFLGQFAWIVHVIAGLLFLHWITRIFQISHVELGQILRQEFLDLIRRKRSIGSYNMACLFVGVFVGIVTIIVLEIEKAMRFLVQVFGKEQVLVFEKTASFETMFYVVFGFMTLSIVVILLERWRKL